jgi:hypothetical protein
MAPVGKQWRRARCARPARNAADGCDDHWNAYRQIFDPPGLRAKFAQDLLSACIGYIIFEFFGRNRHSGIWSEICFTAGAFPSMD